MMPKTDYHGWRLLCSVRAGHTCYHIHAKCMNTDSSVTSPNGLFTLLSVFMHLACMSSTNNEMLQVHSELSDVHSWMYLYICTGFVRLITIQVLPVLAHWVLFIAYKFSKRCKVFKSCWTYFGVAISVIVKLINSAHHKGSALVPVFNSLGDDSWAPTPRFHS